ncbi:MAG: DUF1565 domain-containing protein [Xenococcaceae cyanobacterium]
MIKRDRLNYCPQNKMIGTKWIASLSLLLILPLITGKIILPRQVLAQTNSRSIISTETNILYVDSARGSDGGEGSQQSPLKTITQALKLAQPDTIIELSPGTYSEETGESFPLIIDKSITLQGSPSSQGHNVIITGNGYFVSPTGAGQQVAIAAIKQAKEITGVSVINPHTRGHGLWIESANPKVTNNTFIRNGNTGLSVNGKSNPIIQNNYFSRNAGNGLLIYGTSKPQVENNEFNNTGFGVSIVQNAAPTLIGNSFSGNRIGVILEGNSQAVLRDNVITNSLEYGLVAIAQSRVNLGTTERPGNNVFRSNQKLDIQNATPYPLNAAGTEINGKTEGNLNLHGTANISVASSPTEIKPLKPLSPLPTQAPARSKPTAQPPTVSELAPNNSDTLPPPKTISAPPSSDSTTNPDEEIIFAVPPDPSTLSNASSNVDLENSPAKTNIVPSKLPVPSFPQTEPQTSEQSSSTNQISSLSDVLGGLSTASNTAKYKVIAEAKDEGEQAEVRSLYPDAFNTVYQGKPMLQIGVFSNQDTAENVLQTLKNIGVDGLIIN